MEQLDALVYAPLEKAFSAVGLTDPLPRAVAVAGITAGVLFYMKPELMFTNGESRKWNVTDPEAVPLSTPMPWWLASALVGGFFGYMI